MLIKNLRKNSNQVTKNIKCASACLTRKLSVNGMRMYGRDISYNMPAS